MYRYKDWDQISLIEGYVCVMVSPDRQGHIVATFPKESGYGRYRNMTPHHHNSSALILCNKSTP
ncbi:uncharacterized protein F5891DRAFT_1007129 [Suillus fuscotomentosus]|uniref:Uncharacterized protein n=1 Tax=Suillus fuscotomentosus TaxID=1912939 RepID=A0AAD4EH02_9AGAM|nr:uncharacterized protein F5891DRAFT_1007129 [Suillus fuscotomentosus]KAG1905901.1 hypothetical protein F5891DRAFT_1007129 [Suillus fuscotomentosus]